MHGDGNVFSCLADMERYLSLPLTLKAFFIIELVSLTGTCALCAQCCHRICGKFSSKLGD